MEMVRGRVELNIDLGELPGEPEELYQLATVANVACGGHAGDARSMERAILACGRYGTRLAAHPSYPDRDGFGRRVLDLPLLALRTSLGEQLTEFVAIATRAGAAVRAIKPHGALYHQATRDHDLARLLVDEALARCGAVAFVGEAGGAVEVAARVAGLPFLREAFADRGYDAGGRMLRRTEPGALLDDPTAAAAQALRFAELGSVDTLCVHGDTPGAVEIARAVHAALSEHGLLRAREPSDVLEGPSK